MKLQHVQWGEEENSTTDKLAWKMCKKCATPVASNYNICIY